VIEIFVLDASNTVVIKTFKKLYSETASANIKLVTMS